MTASLHRRILRRAGRKSYGLIALECEVSRNVVSGVIHRDRRRRKTALKRKPGVSAPKRLPKHKRVKTFETRFLFATSRAMADAIREAAKKSKTSTSEIIRRSLSQAFQ